LRSKIQICGHPTIIEFVRAITTRDLILLENLLHNSGEFKIKNQKNFSDRLVVNKQKFLNWYEVKLKVHSISEVAYDQCLHCSIGKTVLLFNGGKIAEGNKRRIREIKNGVNAQRPRR